jgi:ubiquinone/menaquinone biosynthesis C-methylase UbiE
MPEAPYDAIAEWYDEKIGEPLYQEQILPGVIELAGDVRGLAVLDLACGQGMIARELARRGATVTGVDISTRLLDIARSYEQDDPLGIAYVEADAQSLDTFAEGSFDGVTCSMALMNIENLAACARTVRRVLKPGGWLVAAITHPCYQTPASEWVETNDGPAMLVRRYFSEGYWESSNADSLRGRVGEHHRTLSTYINTFAAAGLLCEHMTEPLASGRRAEQVPGNLEVPSILLMRFKLL